MHTGEGSHPLMETGLNTRAEMCTPKRAHTRTCTTRDGSPESFLIKRSMILCAQGPRHTHTHCRHNDPPQMMPILLRPGLFTRHSCPVAETSWTSTVTSAFSQSLNTRILWNLPRPFPLDPPPHPHHHFVLMHYCKNNSKKNVDKICLRPFPGISGAREGERCSLRVFCQHTGIQKVINKRSLRTLPFIKLLPYELFQERG